MLGTYTLKSDDSTATVNRLMSTLLIYRDVESVLICDATYRVAMHWAEAEMRRILTETSDKLMMVIAGETNADSA